MPAPRPAFGALARSPFQPLPALLTCVCLDPAPQASGSLTCLCFPSPHCVPLGLAEHGAFRLGRLHPRR